MFMDTFSIKAQSVRLFLLIKDLIPRPNLSIYTSILRFHDTGKL